MARLSWYTGRFEELSPGQERIGGRADTGYKQPETVSRQQFRLECQADGSVTVTSVSALNPTKVQLSAGGFQLLNQGESRLLGAGDSVLLLACDVSMFVRLEPTPAEQATGAQPASSGLPQSDEGPPPPLISNGIADGPRAGGSGFGAAERGEPASKRARLEDDARSEQQHQQQPQQDQQQHGRQHQQRPQQDQQQQQAAMVAAAPVMVVMVGLQGAGKSTFCNDLIQRTLAAGGGAPASQQAEQQQQQQQQQARRWARINQDSIAGGKRGTREECLAAAAAALALGSSVLIDRTGISQDQRRPFIRLAQQHGVPVHCVMLKLPTRLCQQRAAARTDHEGGLQGSAAYAAVGQMQRALSEEGDPRTLEGFESVLVCGSDAEAAAALEAWSMFGPQHPDPAAEYARLKPPPPKVNTLDRYFRKAAPAASPAAAPADQQPRSSGQGRIQQQDGPQQQQQQQQQQPATVTGGVGASSSNALQVLMSAAQQQQPQPGAGSASAGAGSATAAAAAVSPAAAAAAGGAGAGGGRKLKRHTFESCSGWAGMLAAIARNPESCRAEQPGLWYDERCVWMRDKFPKASEHWLVLARDAQLEGPLDLGSEDAPLLEQMVAVASRRIALLKAARPHLRFRFGFHAVPSCRQLHMHVISQDFNSAGLKHKKHWNSFTAAGFFLDAAWVLQELRGPTGMLEYSPREKEALLKGDLRCHRCSAAQSNMPRLKQHVAGCGAPLPLEHLY